jgi:hypothetical protein
LPKFDDSAEYIGKVRDISHPRHSGASHAIMEVLLSKDALIVEAALKRREGEIPVEYRDKPRERSCGEQTGG